MLTPQYLEHVADDVIELYQKFDEAVARDIARRLLKAGKITDTARWLAQVLQQAGLLYEDVISQVAKLTDTADIYVKRAFEEAGVESVTAELREYYLSGITAPPIKQAENALRILKAGILKTAGELRNLTLTTATATQQTFIDACALAEMQVSHGAFDYVTAIKNAIKDTAKDGAKVLYPSGHSDKVDVAVRRAVLTGVNQTMCNISLQYADEFGCDIMELTAHAGARPSHAAWQGQLVSRSGQRGYLTLSDIGYGTGSGFGGWNCRHSWNPFFVGVSKRAYDKESLEKLNSRDVEYNGEKYTEYEISQMQRQMERNIRASKRELVALDEAINGSYHEDLSASLQSDFGSISKKLQTQRGQLKSFLSQVNQKQDNAREQILGFGKSLATKSTNAAKYHFTAPNIDAIIDKNIRKALALKSDIPINVPSRDVDVDKLGFDHAHIIGRHDADEAQAKQWIKDSIFSATVWNGEFERYYSVQGAVYVDWKNKLIRTAFSSSEFGKNETLLMEVLKKYGII